VQATVAAAARILPLVELPILLSGGGPFQHKHWQHAMAEEVHGLQAKMTGPAFVMSALAAIPVRVSGGRTLVV
jgi:hypothetical protein